MKSRSLFEPSRLLLIFILLLGLGFTIFVFMQIRADRVKDTINAKQNLNVLFVVTQDNKPLFNEVLIYNPVSKKSALVDIPSETGSLIPALGRVDALSILFKPDDMKAYLARISDFLGIEVPFYLILPSDKIEPEIDLISGIDMFIPASIEDVQKNPMILLPSGNNLLDGAKAKDYLMYPQDNEEEADRVNRFQRFIQSWLRKWGENKSFLTRSDAFPILYQGIKTNMEDIGVKTFLTVTAQADWERLVLQRLLGTTRLVDGKKLIFPHYNGTLLKDAVRQILDTLASKDPDQLFGTPVVVEILNGTKSPGLATRTSQLLRSFGYEVGSSKNADTNNQENTVVIDRKGNPDQVKKLADIIKCKKIVQQDDQPTDNTDITIILGKDFDGRYVR